MMNGSKVLMLLMMSAIILLNACRNDEAQENPAQTLTYTFESGTEGWTGGFADHPALDNPSDSSLFELESGRAKLPSPLDNSRYAFFLQGHNRSDDLFMFLKRKISGLQPSRDYDLLFDISLASDAASGAVGIGGAPGESVYLKAGGSDVEPKPVLQNSFYEMNIDKGNQAQGGANMVVLGNVANGTSEFQFTLIRRDNQGKPFRVRSNSQGELWIIIGTDSGFEGFTQLFYDEIKVTVAERQ